MCSHVSSVLVRVHQVYIAKDLSEVELEATQVSMHSMGLGLNL